MDLKDIKTQYQDDKGYIRVLETNSGITIQTSPMIPIVSGDIELKPTTQLPKPKDVSADTIIKYAKGNNIKSTHKRTTPPTGLWFSTPQIERGFIPMSFSKGDPKSIPEAPLFWIPTQNKTSKHSVLQNSLNNARVAKHLQNLALYSYSKMKKEWYSIVKGASYNVEDIKDTLPPANSSFWNGKLIISNEEVLERLKTHIKTETFNNSTLVATFKDRVFLPPVEETSTKKYLTFHTLDDLRKWSLLSGTLKDEFAVYSEMFDCFYPKPYFFRKFGKTYLVQSSKSGRLRDAVGLLKHWNENKINKGYEAEFQEEVEDVPENVCVFDVGFELNLLLKSAKNGITKPSLIDAVLIESRKHTKNVSTSRTWWSNFITYLLDQTIFIREDVGKIYAPTLEAKQKYIIYVAMLPVD